MIAEGLTLSPLLTVLYFFAIALWSAVAAYVVIFGTETGESHGDTGHAASHEPAHAGGHYAPVEPTRAKPFRGFSPYEGFKSYAQGETVTVEDIVKGLARESGASLIHEAHEVHEEKLHAHDTKDVASSAKVNAFLDLLVQGERDALFHFLRDIEEHGEGAEAFLSRILTATEAALKARLEGGVCDIRVMEILGSCETPALEKLVAALSTADARKQSGKLALTRALSALKA